MAEETKHRKVPHDRVPEETRAHARRARQEFMQGLDAMVPPEVREHHRQAHREMLLAWRSMIDFALEKMEAKKE